MWYTAGVIFRPQKAVGKRFPGQALRAKRFPTFSPIYSSVEQLTMHPLVAQLVSQAPVIVDGAWGTQLQARGLPSGESPDAWNLTHPERVEEVPTAYLEAGSQVVLTNTFQASRPALDGHGLAEQVVAINRAGVEISRRAAGTQAKVFATLGPSGKMLFMGQISEEELLQVFTEQTQSLAEAGADALVVETMSDLAEAKVALAAAKATGLPVVACAVFDSGKNNDRTMMGATPEQVAEELTAAGADVVGTNCGQGPATCVDICRRMRAVTDLPLWIKPNAGLPEMEDGQIVYRTTPAEFAESAAAIVEAGASFVGGCCGTSPDFIRALKDRLHR
jgi:methionine synthase I (cobalamin-dependent)